MKAKDILIRALSCISEEGYISKDNALIKGVQSTSSRIQSSFELCSVTSQCMIDQFEAKADVILDWINSLSTSDEYLSKCKSAVQLAETAPEKAYGYLSSLVPAFERYQKNSVGLDRITQRNAFAAETNQVYSGTGEVINVLKHPDYSKVSIVDNQGFYVSFFLKKTGKKLLKVPAIGDTIAVSGRVYSNRLTDPFETTLSRPTIK